jgi:hypothetical protein
MILTSDEHNTNDNRDSHSSANPQQPKSLIQQKFLKPYVVAYLKPRKIAQILT